MAREFGTVKFFNAKEGWGFLTSGASTQDIFVHYQTIRGTGYKVLREGQKVTFELVRHEKGPRATDVEVVRH